MYNKLFFWYLVLSYPSIVEPSSSSFQLWPFPYLPFLQICQSLVVLFLSISMGNSSKMTQDLFLEWASSIGTFREPPLPRLFPVEITYEHSAILIKTRLIAWLIIDSSFFKKYFKINTEPNCFILRSASWLGTLWSTAVLITIFWTHFKDLALWINDVLSFLT